MHTNKLVVIGVGHVGSYVLADAMKTGLFARIGVIDILKNVAFGLGALHPPDEAYRLPIDLACRSGFRGVGAHRHR